jgi:small subunit ribosomal protein S2
MAVVTMRQLLEAGVHFGHQTRRWNPKMRRFIFGERNGIYIIDIQQTIGMLEQAYGFIRDSVARGGSVLFVGTKRQAQEAVEQQALRVGMPYVNFRWLGGMLTNFETIRSRIGRLKDLEDIERSGQIDLLPKKEALSLMREKEKLERNLGGIRTMQRLPNAVWVVDTVKEHIAVKEANRLGIPVVAILDTNCDPDLVQYPIPGNDDAIRAGALLTRIIADACAEGHQLRAARTADDVVAEQAAVAAATDQAGPAAEPLAEWEIALQQEEARKAAEQAAAVAYRGGEEAAEEDEQAVPTAPTPAADRQPNVPPGLDQVADQAESDQRESDQAESDQAESDQAESDQAESDQAESDQAGAEQTKASDADAGQDTEEDTSA